MGVYEFQRDLVDAVIEKAFIRDDSCSDMVAAWRRFGEHMVHATRKLLASPAPSQPAPLETRGLIAMPDEDEDWAEGADDSPQDDGSGGAQLPLNPPSYPAVSNMADTAASNSTPHTSPVPVGAPSITSTVTASFDAESRGVVSATGAGILPSATAPSQPAYIHVEPVVPSKEPPMTSASNPLPFQKAHDVLTPLRVSMTPLPEFASNDEGILNPIAAHDGTFKDLDDPRNDVANGEEPPRSATAPETPPSKPCGANDRNSPMSTTPVAPPGTPLHNLHRGDNDLSNTRNSPASIEATGSKHAVPAAESPLGSKAAEPAANLFASDGSLSDMDVSESSGTSSPSPVRNAKGKGKAAQRAISNRSGMESGKPGQSIKLRPLELRPLVRRENQPRKRQRSASSESELAMWLASPPGRRGQKKPPAKKQQRSPHTKVPPLLAAFPVDPPVEGDALAYPDLLEPSPELASGSDQAAGMDVDAPSVGVPMAMRLELLTPVYSKERDEVTLETRPFNFPYLAKVRFPSPQMFRQFNLHMLLLYSWTIRGRLSPKKIRYCLW